MHANDLMPTDAVRHGAYACLDLRRAARGSADAIEALADTLALRNEYAPGPDHPERAFALLRRVTATPGTIEDAALVDAAAVVHVAAPTLAPVEAFCDGLAAALGPAVTRLLRGIVRPPTFTGTAMHNFAYAHRMLQEPGAAMPHAFLMPTSKTADWWSKDWMERHTYFLPRFDDAGRRASDGHALAAAEGVEVLMRRTYKSPTEPAAAGAYDFINYFECADAGVPVFHRVCASLRDVGRNPEWRYVREGPTWQGRRVAAWADLFL